MKLFVNGYLTSRKNTLIAVLLLTVGIFTASSVYSASHTEAKTYPVHSTPESFSQLAEMASSAVVNIRTVKTIKAAAVFFVTSKKGHLEMMTP